MPSAKAKGGKPQVIRKTVKVAQQLKLTSDSHISAVGDKRLKDAFVISVCVPGISSRQLTFHHPIGITSLESDEWVCTPSFDVTDLLNRTSHPQREEILGKQKAHMRESAVKKGLLREVETDGRVVTVYPSGQNRNDALKEARKKAPKGMDGNEPAYYGSLPTGLAEAERSLMKYYDSSSVIKAAEGKFPMPAYETRSGPLANVPQRSLSLEANDASEAVGKIVAMIAAISSPEEVVPIKTGKKPPSRGRSAFRSRGTSKNTRSKSTK